MADRTPIRSSAVPAHTCPVSGAFTNDGSVPGSKDTFASGDGQTGTRMQLSSWPKAIQTPTQWLRGTATLFAPVPDEALTASERRCSDIARSRHRRRIVEGALCCGRVTVMSRDRVGGGRRSVMSERR
ncbi:hypothetical protein AAFF_G00156690 [Aldrovandia affinis]|uniref:Uncharacterized protein n=1 Tax=Aldrovandia affinis TaxID=143900 RepID=A0AAD7W7U2_9TELE|nr:hypothetical protein AAFF_G00156690 [Aldrovandia affinis]